jgi:hypothetical protein
MKFDSSVALRIVDDLTQIMSEQSQNLGIVEAACQTQRQGQEGFLVWHYVLYNEVSFVATNGHVESLYTSICDDYAKTEFDRLKAELEIQ